MLEQLAYGMLDVVSIYTFCSVFSDALALLECLVSSTGKVPRVSGPFGVLFEECYRARVHAHSSIGEKYV